MNFTTNLNIPDGVFSHSDLATLNNTTNQKVWAEYSRLRKENIIVSAGTRPNPSGKGKSTLLWKLADGKPVPVIDIPVIPRVPSQRKPKVALEKVVAAKVEPMVNDSLEQIKPATPPVQVIEVEIPKIVKESPKIDDLRPVVRSAVLSDVETTSYLCPICKTPLRTGNDSTGVMVWCGVIDKRICSPNESPYGHSMKNVKEAYETLCDKYKLNR